MQTHLHPAQSKVLYVLRHTDAARYNELMKETDLDSDIFKFHIKKLAHDGLIEKLVDGSYTLTALGKEYANRIDERTGREHAQPKLSMLLVVRSKVDGEFIYLAHRRKRQPFSGYWGFMSAPVIYGGEAAKSANRELKKQTGLKADFKVASTFRVIDKDTEGNLLEDKAFLILIAQIDVPSEPKDWHGGDHEWLAAEELLTKKPLFAITQEAINCFDQPSSFREFTLTYSPDEY